MIWLLAECYRFSPNDIWEMDIEELQFWLQGALWIKEQKVF